MRQPKALTVSEIVGGQFHIHVRVDICGHMDIEYPVFCGKPFKLDRLNGQWIRTKISFINSEYEEEQSTEALGLEPTKHNHHRVFKFNSDNRRVLKKLVENQDLGGYLKLIGLDNVTEAVAHYQREADEADLWSDVWDKEEDDLYDFDVDMDLGRDPYEGGLPFD